MKLSEHTEHIRLLIDKAFRNQLGRMGFTNHTLGVSADSWSDDQRRLNGILENFTGETQSSEKAFEKLVEELTFTLFNRMAAMKVMEAHTLHPEIITRRSQHGDRSFAQYAWLEQHPDGREEEAEGIKLFLEDQLQHLSGEIPLFSPHHPYHLLPSAIELNAIIDAFNGVEKDTHVDADIWKSDDVLGWLYESYNESKKKAHKESGAKTEYDKVSIQSQVYTPRWVVKFLVDNSLGKLYLEMYPDSWIKDRYKIANAPVRQTRDHKPMHDIKLIDPAPGSGNFLLYAFDLLYDMYTDQIENYGADYDDEDIAKLIIEKNLYGVDLDDRAVQLAQLGLYIKAKRRNRRIRIDYFNVISSDFYLPRFSEVKELFENGEPLDAELERIVVGIWDDLQQAFKFGSLIRVEENFNARLNVLESTLHSPQQNLFAEPQIAYYRDFRRTFFQSLKTALARKTVTQGLTFLNSKTRDAIAFLEIISQKYDVAVANPPYTDSADFGPELKKFVDANYKQPYKFHSNLYAAFIKRCFELIDDHGKMALIHPLTFMYIKSFEDVRKFILQKLHINVFVDYGLSNLFGSVMVDPAFYVFEKVSSKKENSWFISLDQYTRTPNEKFKKEFCLEALDDYIANRPNKHNISLSQEKLKIIEGWPFIYWISDGFREKFKEKSLNDYVAACSGLATCNNDMFLRYWWEIHDHQSQHSSLESKWFKYAKGGPYNKWQGNLWITVNWEKSGLAIHNYNNIPLDYNGAPVRNKRFYFKEGVTYSASGSKGATYRYLPKNCIFDVGGASIFFTKSYNNVQYLLALLNSHLTSYIIDCLNPTVNTQVGDLRRIPFIVPNSNSEKTVSELSSQCVVAKETLNSFKIFETNFVQSPLQVFQESTLKDRILTYFNYENAHLTQVLINEAIINELIYELYELSDTDREQVEAKMGKSIGQLGIVNCKTGDSKTIVDLFVEDANIENDVVLEHVRRLPFIEFEPDRIREIKEGFSSLYQSNNDLEEFCIRHQVNPINVWYWFKAAGIMPQGRAHDIALEFLADAIRTILMADNDGIIPLVGLPGEPRLLDRLEEHCLNNGFTPAQFLQLDGLLGRPLNDYIEHHFFRNLSDHLNLFMYLPKTPFIWHLSSGEHQGFEAYIIIYKWNRDSLFKIKSQYLAKRSENLHYRQLQLKDSDTAQALSEKERVRLQLQEIDQYAAKIEELIAEGYDPVLDDGVGKNIAPLQNKGMLRAEVLNKKQLQKYLHADW